MSAAPAVFAGLLPSFGLETHRQAWPFGPFGPFVASAAGGTDWGAQLGSWGNAFGCRICRVALLAPDPRTLGQSHLLRWRWREREIMIKHDWAYLSLYDIIYHIPNLFKMTTHVPTTWPIHWSLMRWELITEHSGRISPDNRTCSFLRCTSSKTNDFPLLCYTTRGYTVHHQVRIETAMICLDPISPMLCIWILHLFIDRERY